MKVTTAQQFETIRKNDLKKKKLLESTVNFTSGSFFALAENVPDIICRFDRQYYHLYVNPAIEKITGAPTSAFIGKTTHEVGMSPEFAQLWNTQIQQVFDSKKQSMFEFSFPTSEGMRYFQSSVVPEFDSDGKVETVLSISRDITVMRESEMEKDSFIAMVTHELKTPITNVKAFAQLMEKRFSKAGDRANATYLTKMDSQLNRLNKLVGDLLDATRIGTGKMQFNEIVFSFGDLLKEVAGDIRKTTKHPVVLRKISSVKVHADRDRIGQVLLNLLSNAIKYSPDKLPVLINAHVENGILRCCVSDRGPGIPIAQQDKLFKKFSRLTEKNHANSAGLGLGLYISSKIVEQEGGSIWVESLGLDEKGSTFCFTLPVNKSQ